MVGILKIDDRGKRYDQALQLRFVLLRMYGLQRGLYTDEEAVFEFTLY
jgi:hypothetical protein